MMKSINIKQRTMVLITISILFIGTSTYLSLPYIKNWRQQYSYKLELLGDNHPDEALAFYRKAEFIYPNESLYLKIGELYDRSDKLDLAERYFTKIESETITLELVNHYLKTGNTDKARALLKNVQHSNDYLYFHTLILALDSPKETLESIPKTNNQKLTEFKTYLSSIANNTNTEYTETAIALYLYNNNYNDLAIKKLEILNESNYKDAYLLLGDIYYSQELYKNTAIAYEKARNIDPYDVDVYQKLILVYEKLNDNNKSDEYKKILENLSIQN